MKNSELRIIVVIISLGVFLGASMGSYYLYEKFMVKKPLIEKLASMPNISNVYVDENDDGFIIEFQLDKVENIEKELIQVNEKIKTILKDKKYDVNIKDRRNQKLELLFDDVQVAVYDAMANNKFVWLNQELARYIEPTGMTYKMLIDDKHLYLQFEDGNDYLYEIIDRYSDDVA